jgi:putative colanic acid biosynthesis acetyltransferase WcaF
MTGKRDLSKFLTPTKRMFFLKLSAWFIISRLVFGLPSTSYLRCFVLKMFGSSVGSSVVIRRGVRIQFPWQIKIGSNCWIGEQAWFINHANISIGSNVCISQRSIICSGGHDYRSASLEYAHQPIEIKDGAWVCLDAKVLPGVTIGECSVISAGEIARKSVPDFSMLIGGEIRPIDAPK